MSKVFNMVGGGGGKNVSSICITRLSSTDTITCTKDGKSYPATWDETAQRWEIVGLPLGTFTVTATNGAKTTTETVLIDIAGVYEIEMNYVLWLYKDGDECEDVTGGWYFQKESGTSYMTKENSYLDVRAPVSSDGHLKTNNIVSLFGYTKINFEYSYNCGTTYSKFHSHLGTIDIIVSSSVKVSSPASITFDQERASNFAYVANFGSGYLRIHKIWLE